MGTRPGSDRFVTRWLDDVLVLVDLRSNRLYELNATAGRAWELVQAGHSLAEAQAILAREYDVDEGTLSAQLHEMVGALRAVALIDG